MKNFLKFLLIGLLCLAPTLGSDAKQRVAGLVSPQAIDVDLGFVQVGNVGNLSVMGAPSGATFSLLNNPGGHFSIVGTEIVADPSTPAGQYSLSVRASGSGFKPKTKTFVLNFAGTPAPTPGSFFVGVNLGGAQGPSPVFPSAAAINYYAARLNGSGPFRIPISWSITQTFPPFATTGIQPTAFGDLDTTSNNYSAGSNLLGNSQAMGTNGADLNQWSVFLTGSGTVGQTNNAGVDPNGGNTATLLTFDRADVTSFSQLQQQFAAVGGGPATGSGFFYLKAATPGDVGKTVAISLYNNNYVGVVNVTLTNSWVKYDCTSIAGPYYIVMGYLGTLSNPQIGSVGVLAWGAQANPGSTSLPYAPTNAGYLGALDQLVSNAVAANAQVFLDVHMFGEGPGGNPIGSGPVPISAFADLVGKIAAHYVSQPALLAGIYGIDVMNEWKFIDSSIAFNANQAAITAIRNAGYTGFIIIEGVNFTSAWNWVSGQGQSFNNSNLYQLVDPLNKLIFSPHMYPDADDSWSQSTSFGYAVNAAVPGTAPVGLNTNPMIGVQRMSAEYGPWAASHGVSTILGEYGSSNDSPWAQGTFDSADWNIISRNLLTYLQTNKMGFTIWSGGPGFQTGYNSVGYVGSIDPASNTSPGQPDFSPTGGVQHPVMAVLDEFTGYTGPQPTAYALVAAGAPNQQFYATIGTPTAPYTVYYGGKITSSVTITPHATLTDLVTPVSGTFSPATLTAAPGENFVGHFTFNASQAATIVISTTNTGGWTDPPGIGISSIVDGYVGLSGSPSNIYGMYNRYTPNVGPSLRLERASDAQQMDWGFTLPNSAGYNGFDRVAIQSWAGAQNGIKIVKIYGIGPGQQNPISFFGTTFPTLNLQNSAGYPEIVVPAGVKGDPTVGAGDANFFTPVANQNAFYTIARMNQSSSAAKGLWQMDWDNGPVGFTPTGMQIFSTGYNTDGNVGPPTFPASPVPQYPQATINTTLSWNITNNAYHEYGASYTSNVTNGFGTYKDGSPVAQATINYQLTTNNKAGTAQFANYKYSAIFWLGSLYNLEIGMGFALTDAQQANISSIDSTYYSTALPDGPLPAAPPQITRVITSLPIYPGFIPARPFGLLLVNDPTSGATDTVTITLTGAAGTLSGSGISGTGPYTVGPDTPANVTIALNDAVFTTAAGVGSTTNFSILVTSSSGATASNGSTNTTVSTYSAQTSFTPPGGTFTPVNHSGYNLAGGELDVIQSLGPSHAQMDYMSGKGFGLYRYVISSKYLYTTTFGPLNSTYLAAMKAAIDYAYTKNLYVVIDPHDGGNVWDAVFGGMAHILPSNRSQDLFQDEWRRIATAFKNYPNVIFGLNNEPAGISAVQWRDGGVTPSITAIRGVGATQLILIPGVGQSSASGWASNGNTAAFAGYAGDTLNNSAYEAHQYLDAGQSGFGSVATVNGSTILGTFNSFLTTNGFKGFLGEFGMAFDPFLCLSPDTIHYNTAGTNVTTNSITQNSSMLSGMVSSGLYVGWAAWGGGYEWATPPTAAGYAFNPEPPRNGFNYVIPIVDQPQIVPLLSNTINFLLKRDLDPSSNDNDPMWLEKAA